jgi:hypothetical protein
MLHMASIGYFFLNIFLSATQRKRCSWQKMGPPAARQWLTGGTYIRTYWRGSYSFENSTCFLTNTRHSQNDVEGSLKSCSLDGSSWHDYSFHPPHSTNSSYCTLSFKPNSEFVFHLMCSVLRSSLHAIGHEKISTVDWRKISYPVTRELFIHIRDTVGQLLRFYLRSVLKLAGICNDPPLNGNGKLQWLAF